ncbi:MAG TPA: LPS export ABC transporter periplasmic protein LptC [Balneolaceae bacterium]|nr:LPS export ABC transporter periplasmic protein LptC [Balneolaceae bacterium]
MSTSFRILIPSMLLLAALGCGELSEYENQQVQEALSDSLFTTTQSWDVDMEVLEQVRLKLRLQGSYATTTKNEHQNVTRISGPVYIEIYDEEGQTETIVDADSAIHRPDNMEFELFGNVEVQAKGGKILRSDYLKWQREQDRVSTTDFVIFISPPDSIAANGFYGNSDLTNYTLNEGGGRTVID